MYTIGYSDFLKYSNVIEYILEDILNLDYDLKIKICERDITVHEWNQIFTNSIGWLGLRSWRLSYLFEIEDVVIGLGVRHQIFDIPNFIIERDRDVAKTIRDRRDLRKILD